MNQKPQNIAGLILRDIFSEILRAICLRNAPVNVFENSGDVVITHVYENLSHILTNLLKNNQSKSQNSEELRYQ